MSKVKIVLTDTEVRIYADFNGVEGYILNSDFILLNLTGYGTLSSLSFHQIKLSDGQRLKFSDPDGTSAYGIVYFDVKRIKSNCSGWFAKLRNDQIFQDKPLDQHYIPHLCFNCRQSLVAHFKKVGQQYKENCPFCNTPVMFPLLSP